MTKMTMMLAAFAVAGTSLVFGGAARAQTTTAYLANSGNNASCLRSSPCSSLGQAIVAAAAGGSIVCLDALDIVGSATFLKTVTLDCPLGRFNFGNGATLTIDGSGAGGGGSGIVVKLRNLTLVGFGALGGQGGTAINFVTGAALHIENVNVSGFGVSPAVGLKFAPTTNGAKLFVTDSIFTDNGTGSAGGGIVVQPAAGGTAQVSINRTTIAKNTFGAVIDGTGSTGGINMTIENSVLSGNVNDGALGTTPAGGAPLGLAVVNTQSLNNGFGIRATGNATVRVKNSEMIGNGTGVQAVGAAQLLSNGTNTVEANGTNGAFTGSFAFK